MIASSKQHRAKPKDLQVYVVKRAGRTNYELKWYDFRQERWRTESSGVPVGTSRDYKRAVQAAGEKQKQLRAGNDPANITWEEFREEYTKYLRGRERRGKRRIKGSTIVRVLNSFVAIERILAPAKVKDIREADINRFSGIRCEDDDVSLSTVACDLRHLKAALRWAASKGFISKCPPFEIPETESKGCALNDEQFERMLSKVEDVLTGKWVPSAKLAKRKSKEPPAPREVAPASIEAWRQFLRALWLSGLRLSECLGLSWDADSPYHVYLDQGEAFFKFSGEHVKSGRDESLAAAPDFAEFLEQIPPEQRHGLVFKLPRLGGIYSESQLTRVTAGRIISAFGEAAGIVVSRQARSNGKLKLKYASAHDLRRSFGTRWSELVLPQVLQVMMRHSDISTTMKFYVFAEARRMAAIARLAMESHRRVVTDCGAPGETRNGRDGK